MIVREAFGEEGGVFSSLYRGRGGMADAGDLKSLDFGREGSSPSAPTTWARSSAG